jgi:hypothetical protein
MDGPQKQQVQNDDQAKAEQMFAGFSLLVGVIIHGH